MANVRAMVVDDSAAMRALFCGILENAKGVDVCGTASNADEARAKMNDLKPDVLTLDVEMPGMSGLDFLSEIMETRPMPVIMLSSITQEGTGTMQKALDLGAVHCFPKPLNCSGAEFDETVKRLGDIVIRAARGELNNDGASSPAPVAEEVSEVAQEAPASDYACDGRTVALACGPAGLKPIAQILSAYPANCPPTVVIVNTPSEALAEELAALKDELACKVEIAANGVAVDPGCVILAPDGIQHVMIEPGSPPRIRMVDRDPIGGFRPSADLLFGSLVRSQISAIAGVFPAVGADGVKGLQMLAGAGNATFAQTPSANEPGERFDAISRLGVGAQTLDADAVAQWILEQTSKK